jgi:hypothetical protein
VLLAAVESVDHSAQNLRLVGQFFRRGGPDADDEIGLVGIDGAALDRLDAFLDHSHGLEKFRITGGGVIAAHAPELFLLAADDLVLVRWIQIGGDRIVEEISLREQKDGLRIGAVRQTTDG